MSVRFDAPALRRLGEWLRTQLYTFTAVTPATHARVLPRIACARSLRDVFGWNAPFERKRFTHAAALLEEAGALVEDDLCRSRVRYATLGTMIFVHSAFPTLAEDSVFFGPDTYRFARALERLPPRLGRVIDVGCGSGAGGLALANRAAQVVLADISPTARHAAATNVALNSFDDVTIASSDVLDGISGPIDWVIANPPFLVDARNRTYRDGGGTLGTGLAVRIVEETIARGARLLLYSGAPIVDGNDVLREALQRYDVQYEETDPDIFGEELDAPAYASVERIAAVVVRR